MKAICISGSRNPNGQTASAAKAIIDGLSAEGVQCEQFFLPAMRIERCRQCDERGWGICRTEGKCVIEDDFAELADRIRQADVVVFANPVYFADLSESLRAFLDRLRRVTRHDDGKTGIVETPTVGVCVAGGGGGGAPFCCMSLERVLATCGFDVLDMIAVRRQNLQAKLARLELAGQSLAEDAGK